MKKLFTGIFALAMVLSLVFIGELTSSGKNALSAQAQTVTVKRKRRGGVVGGTRYVAHKTKRGAKYVAHKTKRGAIYVGRKTAQGTRYVAHKTKRGTKKAYHITKKAIVGQ